MKKDIVAVNGDRICPVVCNAQAILSGTWRLCISSERKTSPPHTHTLSGEEKTVERFWVSGLVLVVFFFVLNRDILWHFLNWKEH